MLSKKQINSKKFFTFTKVRTWDLQINSPPPYHSPEKNCISIAAKEPKLSKKANRCNLLIGLPLNLPFELTLNMKLDGLRVEQWTLDLEVPGSNLGEGEMFFLVYLLF